MSRQDPQAKSSDLPVWPGFALAAAIGLIYFLAAGGGTLKLGQSQCPHLVLIADAWLHGQLFVRNEALRQVDREYRDRVFRPRVSEQVTRRRLQLTRADEDRIVAAPKSPVLHDWSPVGERYYGYFSPMGSALMLPFVAAAGIRASDHLFTVAAGILSVFFTYMMLREARRAVLLKLSPTACAALTVLLGLGTVHFYCACVAQVWFTVQIVTVMWMNLALWVVFRSQGRLGWLAAGGAAFGATFLTRNPALFVLPFFLIFVWKVGRSGRPAAAGRLTRLWCFMLPVVAAGFVQLAFNHARFGSMFESGQSVQIRSELGNPRFVADFERYGHLHPHYLPRNLYYYFLNPRLPESRRTGIRTFDPEGNSVFLVTPAMLMVLLSWRRRDWFTVALWIAAGATLAVLLLFRATGYFQFGNRYLLDLMPLLILLVAVGMRGRLSVGACVLILLSVGVNGWGTREFSREVQWYATLPADEATLLIERGRYDQAERILRENMRRAPQQREWAENLAWLLATCPQADIRDGAEAVRIAERLARETQFDDARILDTSAAAYAESGDFERAIRTARQALMLAESRGFASLARGIEQRVRLYEARQPIRD